MASKSKFELIQRLFILAHQYEEAMRETKANVGSKDFYKYCDRATRIHTEMLMAQTKLVFCYFGREKQQVFDHYNSWKFGPVARFW